ncbi:hypothetical protein RVM26_03510 [Halomonas sp. KM072]
MSLVNKKINFKEFGLDFNYFFHMKGERNLLVFMPSAMSNREVIPKFSRWSWMEEVKGFDSICVADPTLHLSESILGGWLQGTQEVWALERIVSHIYLLSLVHDYDKIIFHGSSLGGFGAIQSVVLMNNMFNINALFLAENPQIDLAIYQWKRHRDTVAKVVYGKDVIEDVDSEYLHRLNVSKTIEKLWGQDFSPRGVVVAKESDRHHYEEHVIPFLGYLKSNFKECMVDLHLISAHEDASGHTALDKERFFRELSELVEDA